MEFCDMCQSAGSVNAHGLCEICGNEVDFEDAIAQTAEAVATF